jgi:site-specific DNA recombinase
MSTATLTDAIIYLRLSDFRDEDDTTFIQREAELRAFAALLGLNVVRVAVENDVNGNGKSRPASAYKTPLEVTTPSGLVTFRTNRPVFNSVVLDLQRGTAGVLIVSDDSRISRNHRDGQDLLDACRKGKASVVAPDDDGNPRWLLTGGGTKAEVSAFQDRINDARKYSDDIAAKVRRGRRRWAGKSYQGGRRPYGYQVAPDTAEHHRNLVIDQAEAKIIKKAAADILDRGISLKAIARDLRDRGVPTVTGTVWTASTLRDVLAKPAVAGLAAHHKELRPAPWPAILERGQWERLTALFDSRKTGTSPEPRWLLSCYATCGVCGGPVKCTGSAARRAYTCTGHGHVRRAALAVDEYVTTQVVDLIGAAPDLLRPRPRPEVDVKALRAEARKLERKLDDLARLLTEDVLTEAGVRAERKRIGAQLAKIGTRLAASDEADPLPEFRGRPAAEAWESLSLPRRRAVVRLLVTVTILPARKGAHGFDFGSVRIERKAQP